MLTHLITHCLSGCSIPATAVVLLSYFLAFLDFAEFNVAFLGAVHLDSIMTFPSLTKRRLPFTFSCKMAILPAGRVVNLVFPALVCVVLLNEEVLLASPLTFIRLLSDGVLSFYCCPLC